MQTRNKPGRKLSEELKQVIEPIYRRDPARYENLCRFVWMQQKRGFSDQAIRQCLELAGSRIDLSSNWWAYLQKLMAKGSARAYEAENNEFKKGDLNKFGVILKKIVAGL